MQFLKNIEEIRARARQQIASGAVTKDYPLDRQQTISILNEALATELVCVLRYKFHYFMATGIHSAGVAAEFLQHAQEEQEHADRIAKRIKQLGGKPEITRFKGLGEISPDEFGRFIGNEMKLQHVLLEHGDHIQELLEKFMGKNTPQRQEFIIENLKIEMDTPITEDGKKMADA